MDYENENNDRLVDGDVNQDEVKHEVLLRPIDFSEYIGQKKVVQNVEVMVESA